MFRLLGLLAALVVALAPSASRCAPGDVDTAFDPQVNSHPLGIGIQPDGNINLVSWFARIGGDPRAGIGRIFPDGSHDGSHDGSFRNPNMEGTIHGIVVQSDGKIVIGGSFTKVNGTTRNRMARFSPNGVLDSRFAPNLDDALDEHDAAGRWQIDHHR